MFARVEGPEPMAKGLMGNSIEESLAAIENGDLGPLAIQFEERENHYLPAGRMIVFGTDF